MREKHGAKNKVGMSEGRGEVGEDGGKKWRQREQKDGGKSQKIKKCEGEKERVADRTVSGNGRSKKSR